MADCLSGRSGRQMLSEWARAWGPLVCLWISGVFALAVLATAASDAESEAVAVDAPAAVTVGSREDDLRRDVLVRVENAPPAVVRSQAEGVLTSLVAGAGTRPVSGDVIATVDGRAVRLFVAGAPLFRAIQGGDEGEDVEHLSQFLAELGHLDPSRAGSRVTPAVAAAVRAFQSDRGDPRDGVFRPEYVAFAPEGGVEVVKQLAAVGDHLAAGDGLVEFAGPAVSATLLPAQEGETLSPLTNRELLLVAGESSVVLDGPEVPPEQLPEVIQLLTHGVSAGTVQPPGEDSGTFGGAVLALREPEVRGVVPTTALHGNRHGTLCVFIDERGEFRARRVPYAPPVPGEVGLTFVPAEFVRAEVAPDPRVLTEEVRAECA